MKAIFQYILLVLKIYNSCYVTINILRYWQCVSERGQKKRYIICYVSEVQFCLQIALWKNKMENSRVIHLYIYPIFF